MKRSEMIKQLYSDFDGKYTENTIHEILFSLENYGMLPPSFYFATTGEYAPVKTIIKEINDSYDGNFQWEDFEEKECCGGGCHEKD